MKSYIQYEQFDSIYDLNKWLKHVKRGYKKVNETRIKIHETQCGPPRVHRMNRKAWFEVITR